MHALRFIVGLIALTFLAQVPCAYAQEPTDAGVPQLVEGDEPGSLRVLLFGPNNAALAQVSLEVLGSSTTSDESGTAQLSLPEGTHTLRLRVPREQVPQAPSVEAHWVVDLADISIVASETTEVIVTLSASGALAGLDIQAPQAGGGSRSMEREFQKALTEKPTGKVHGTVASAESGELVAGARVYVRGVPVEGETDAQGEFTLELPEGSYQFSVIHGKYSTQSVPDVVVQGGQTATLRVDLSPASVELDELIVTAPHIQGGIASLISERRESSAVADVIGSQQMARAGASNAASALSRVTGLTVVDGKFVVVRGMGERYSSMLVNNMFIPSPEPTRRVVPLDLFPAGILESVVVQKTFSPDMPAEFGGGMIQLRTRGYPERFIANVSVSGGYNSQSTFRNNLNYRGGSWDFLGVDDKTRDLPQAIEDAGKIKPYGVFNPGPNKGFMDPERKEFAKLLANNYAIRRETTLPDLTLNASIGNLFKLRHAKLGFVAAVGYRSQSRVLDNSINRTVNNTINGLSVLTDLRLDSFERQVSPNAFLDWGVEFSENHKLKFTTMLLRQTDDTTQYVTGQTDIADIRRTRLGWIETQLFDQQLSGKHVFPKAHDLQADWRYSFARASRSEPDRRDYLYSLVDSSYELSQGPGDFERLFGTLSDDTHQAGLDLTQPFKIWAGLKAKAKVGALAYLRDRESEVRRFEFEGGLDNQLATLPIEQVYTASNIDQHFLIEEVTEAQDAYTAKARLGAAYAMLELPLVEELEVMAGARLERSTTSVTSFDQFDPAAQPAVANLKNTDVLPSATATWHALEDLQLRLGYGRTLNRPDLRELSTSAYTDIVTNSTFQGEPTLKRALIDNLDARLEYYYSSDEVFSAGFFYKNFTDPIEVVLKTTADDGLFSVQNSDRAKLYGFELEARKRFDFISDKLDPLYTAGNFTWIASEVSYEVENASGGRDTKSRPLQSQSPWVLNLQLGYDDDTKDGNGLAASVLYNISGARLRAIGDPLSGIPDIYEQPFHSLDLVVSQRLPRGFKLGVRGQNLLNATQRWKQGDIVVREFKRGAYLTVNVAWSY